MYSMFISSKSETVSPVCKAGTDGAPQTTPKISINTNKDLNNNGSSSKSSLSSSPSLYSYMHSPKEAIQRLLFGYHCKTKRTLAEEAECGDEISVNSWVKDGVDPNGFDEYGYTPLLNAAVLGRLNAVTELINCGADVNKKGAFGFTPLHAAAQNGRREVVLFVLEHNADINAQNDDRDTPMHLALRANHIEIVNMLLRHGANPLIKGFQSKDCVECAQDLGLPDLAHTFESYGSTVSAQIVHSTP